MYYLAMKVYYLFMDIYIILKINLDNVNAGHLGGNGIIKNNNKILIKKNIYFYIIKYIYIYIYVTKTN